ncbi:S-layer protein [Paenibacillus sp. 598K]|nr:S-layer protein [Paenibacillus sp. 598K]
MLCIALLFGIVVPAAQAEDAEPTFTVGVSEEQSVDVGDEITIKVRAEALKDVFGYELVVAYDREALTFVRAASLQMPGFAVTPLVREGQAGGADEIVFAFTKVGATTAAISGAADLASLTFRAAEAGETQVSLTQVKAVKKDTTASTYKPGARLELAIVEQETPPEPEPAPAFLDVSEGHWAKSAIDRAVALGIVKGYADGTFKPQQPVTRAEFVTMLVRALQPSAQQAIADPTFKDAAQIGAWARAEIALAVTNGWINGFDDGTFRPGQQITRAEMTTIAARALGLLEIGEERSEAEMAGFADWAAVPAWAKPAFVVAVAEGLIQGRGADQLAPQAPTNRAEAVVLILRLLDAAAGDVQTLG